MLVLRDGSSVQVNHGHVKRAAVKLRRTPSFCVSSDAIGSLACFHSVAHDEKFWGGRE
jgi:hypothetical protein